MLYLAGIGHCIRPDDMRYIRDQLIQIDPVPGRIAFLNCVAHVRNDIVGAAPVCLHVDKDLAQRSRVLLTLVDRPHSSIRIRDDGRERLVQLMGERGSHLTEQAYSGQKIDLLVLAPRFFFGKLARRNIDHRSQNQSAMRSLNWI